MTMYNFGAPRVGNGAFAREYNSLNNNSFRVVNQNDIVSRLPRGQNASILLNYEVNPYDISPSSDRNALPSIQDAQF